MNVDNLMGFLVIDIASPQGRLEGDVHADAR